MTRRNFLLLVAVLALTMRLIFVAVYEGHNYYHGLSEPYEELARNFMAGEGFALLTDVSPLGAESRFEYVPYVARPIGYALFQIPFLAAFGSTLAVQIAQALLSVLGVILLFKTAELVFSSSIARMTALVAALWPLTARFEISLLPDATVAVFLIGSTFFYVKAFHTRSWKYLLLSALCIGLSIFMKPNGALLAFFFAAHILLAWQKQRLRHAFLIVAASGLLLIPNIVRNYEHTGEFIPFGLGVGISLWEGLSDFGPMHGTVLDDQKLAEMEGYRSWAYPNPVERERARTQYALDVIAEHPWWYAGVMLRRIPLLFTVHPSLFVSPSLQEFRSATGSSSLLEYGLAHPLQALLIGGIALSSYLLVLLSFIGVWLMWREWRVVSIFLIVPLCFILLHLPQHVESRYFYPAVSHLIPLAVMCFAYGLGKPSTIMRVP